LRVENRQALVSRRAINKDSAQEVDVVPIAFLDDIVQRAGINLELVGVAPDDPIALLEVLVDDSALMPDYCRGVVLVVLTVAVFNPERGQRLEKLSEFAIPRFLRHARLELQSQKKSLDAETSIMLNELREPRNPIRFQRA